MRARVLAPAALAVALTAAPGCFTMWAVDGLERPSGRSSRPLGAYVEAPGSGRERLVVVVEGEVERARPFLRMVDYDRGPGGETVSLVFDLTDEDEVLDVARWSASGGIPPDAEPSSWLPPGVREASVVSHDRVEAVAAVQVGDRVRRVRLAFEPSAARQVGFGALVPFTVVLDAALLPLYLIGGLVILSL